jgi:type VI secretion system protein ImpA
MNIDELLLPISDEAPCGEDMSFSAEFDAIQELRREDDPTLAQGEWVTENKVADWPGVAALCTTVLNKRSKDLRVAGWWTDAITRTQGLPGLAAGLTLVARLIDDRWDTLHPQIEDGDVEPRVGNLHWLLARVEVLCRLAPITTPMRGRRLSLIDIDAARARQQAISKGTLDVKTAKAEGAVLLDELQRHITSTGATAFDDTQAQIKAVQSALLSLQTSVDARLGVDGPGFVAARKAVDVAVDAIARLGRDSGFGAANASPTGHSDEAFGASVGNGAGGSQGSGAGGIGGGPVTTRAQALQQLREVAGFFRRTEPHSPVAYLADKAARWGDMPLHAWLRAVLKDGGTLAQLEEILGVEPLPGASDSDTPEA